MRDEDWLKLNDDGLERLLLERWLYRGALLGVMLVAAIAVTYLGIQGVTSLVDRLTVGALVALGIAAGVITFIMRQHDIKIHRELRRRRRFNP